MSPSRFLKAIISLKTVFSPMSLPTLWASSGQTPISQASGAQPQPSIRSSVSGAPPTGGSGESIQFIRCTRAMNAMSMATMFSTSFRPSAAPRQAASSTFASVRGTSTLTVPLVGESSVSGTMILATTRAAGADISEATIRWPGSAP